MNNIILGTSNYQNIKTGNTVSVTGDGGNAWGYFGPSYKKLAPKLQSLKNDVTKLKEYIEFRKKIEDEYMKSYYDIRLKNLDVNFLLATLYNKFGNNIILLCHEPIEEFCHRRLIADYIELKTGMYIPEIRQDENGNIKKINPIRYKERLKKLMK